MSKIDDLIAKLCPNGVEYKIVKNICSTIVAPKKLEKKYYLEKGKYPIIDQGKKYIIAYSNDESALLKKSEYIIFGDHTREIKFVDFSFIQGADGLKIIQANSNIVPKYLFYSLCSTEIPSRGYNRHWSIVRELSIPVPPLEIQREIVKVLDTFTKLEAELEAELEARRRQYHYYRDQLLNFEGRDDVKIRTLSSLVRYITTGKLNANAMIENGKYPFFTCNANPFRIDTFAFDTEAIIISGNGSQVGHVNYYNGKFNAYQRTYILSVFLNINVKYLLHYLKTYLKKIYSYQLKKRFSTLYNTSNASKF